MTEPIKGCPQPDPPELVRLADGYHYQSEDEMKELTDEQIDELGFTARIHLAAPGTGKQAEAARKLVRAAITADRALNAEDHDPLEPKRLESIADPTLRAVCEAYTNTPGGHIWRPADVPTNGVAAVKTKGKNDSPPAEQQREQAPVAWMTPGGDVTRSKVFADEQSALSFGQQRPTPLYTQPSPSLAELRAKVEALRAKAYGTVHYDAVLAEIDKLGGKV